MGRFLLTLLVLAGLGAGGIYAQWRFRPCDPPLLPLDKWGAPARPKCAPQPAKAETGAQAEVQPPTVTVVKAEMRRFTDRLFVSGTLTAREEVMVAPKIADLTVVEIDAEDGDHVKQGQLLARLDRSQLDALLSQNDAARARADAAIDQARSMVAQSASQLDWATSEYDRAKKLGAGVMAASTVEQRQINQKTAQAALSAAKDAIAVAQADRRARDADREELMVRIARTEVRAPVDGVISRRSAKIGATAAPGGEPLFRIISDGAIDLVADVPEQWLPRLEVGMPATLKLPGVEAPVAGSVRLVDQEVDKASRTGKARIALSDVSHARHRRLRLRRSRSRQPRRRRRADHRDQARRRRRRGAGGARRQGRKPQGEARHRRGRRSRDPLRRQARRDAGGARRLVPAARRQGAADAGDRRRGGLRSEHASQRLRLVDPQADSGHGRRLRC